jgi:N-acetylglucosaminyldiphosphoundecaprenol N-acetyl-beta-D-mannosaminyltransferase
VNSKLPGDHHLHETENATPPDFRRRKVLGTEVTVCDYESSTAAIMYWAKLDEGTYTTCHVNSHGVVYSLSDPAHQEATNQCDLVTPDGSPIVKRLQQLGESLNDRVYGPDLMEMVCREAAEAGIPIGLYGGRSEVLDALAAALRRRYPKIEIAYQYSPPFRPLTPEEKLAEDEEMKSSGARIFFIGLGCPKQELYVHEKKTRGVPGVFMAIGAAIDINSGLQKKCPKWMQRHGLEFLFRLMQNPRRLWKRYAKYPILFILLSTRESMLNRSKLT